MSAVIDRTYEIAGDMEEPLYAIRDFLDGIWLIAGTVDGGQTNALQQIADAARVQRAIVEELRGELFRLTHPHRDKFDAEGCPE